MPRPRRCPAMRNSCDWRAKASSDLNEKYAAIRSDIFYLFHRARRWNAQEGVWMGYERKRGKLADLNAMLRGATGPFRRSRRRDCDPAERAVRHHARYRHAIAARCGATDGGHAGPSAQSARRSMHERGRVVDGYTILQPRVGVSLPSAQRSRFVQLYAGDPGVDPYTRVVSDVYQDLFGEGSFIGKGIYDVDSFEHCCGDFPENAILSHDLIEGAYCRSGLLSDVTLYEEYPSRYFGRHRPPASLDARRLANRRLAVAVGARAIGPARPQSDLCLVAVEDLRQPAPQPGAGGDAAGAARLVVRLAGCRRGVAAVLGERGPAADAVGRGGATCFASRSICRWACICGRRCDRWDGRWPKACCRSSSCRTKHISAPMPSCARWCAWVGRSGGCSNGRPPAIRNAAPTAAWRIRSARWRSRRRWPSRHCCCWLCYDRDGVALRRALARRVDCFAAGRLVAEPADSASPRCGSPRASGTFSRSCRARPGGTSRSSSPRKTTGCRRTTSSRIPTWWSHRAPVRPTSAWRCWRTWRPTISATAPPRSCSTRTQHTLDTLARMERYRGHFFNWYDTRSLAPLHPRYVSTVDSGNLAANLLVLGSGCAELSEARILPPRMFGGLRDTLRVLLDVARGTDGPLVDADVLRKIERQIEDLDQAPVDAWRCQCPAIATDRRRRRTDRRCGRAMRNLPGGRTPIERSLQRPSSRPAASGDLARLACAASRSLGTRLRRASRATGYDCARRSSDWTPRPRCGTSPKCQRRLCR